VGQCGIQMGQSIWEQYCAEHGVTERGTVANIDDAGNIECFFEETRRGRYTPRNLMIDLEPNVIDDVKTSRLAGLFHPDFLLSRNHGSGGVFVNAYHYEGNDMIPEINEQLRKLVDNCDNFQGFMCANSVNGGTGSGLGCLLLELLGQEYKKKSKFGTHVFPSPTISSSPLEPYNSVLALEGLAESWVDVSICLDNESLYEICQRNLDIKHPSFDNINRLIAKAVSSITASMRFGGELNTNLDHFQMNLVAFPRLHFMIPSMSTIIPEQKKGTMRNDVQSITNECFDPRNFFVKIPDFDVEEDKYMAISLQYRGDVVAKSVNEAVQQAKRDNKMKLVEWVPTGFKVGLNQQPAALVYDDDLAQLEKNVVMMANNTAISRVFFERILKKFDMMHSLPVRRWFHGWYQPAPFKHWYTWSAKHDSLWNARESCRLLQMDYMQLLHEEASDEESMDDEES